jgi:hypothetical protein
MKTTTATTTINSAALRAGALLAMDAAVEAAEPTDTISARSYTHAAMPGRVVVRLVHSQLAVAADTEAELMGFGAPVASAPLAKTKRVPLGFPAWAIVNDPKHAAFALSVMKDFKRAAKLAKTKPGHAKDGFDALAKILSSSVPHFLPTFWEEAGRAFVDAESQNQGAVAFEKARRAEKAYSLTVDETRRQQAFLEFALAGALSTKTLSQYAIDLKDHKDHKAAFHIYRDLCVRRLQGGLSPSSSMQDELSALAKIAGLAVAAEEESFLLEVLTCTGMARASMVFWKSAKPILVRLSANPATRAKVQNALLALVMRPTGKSDGAVAFYIDMLDACGAIDAALGKDKAKGDTVAFPSGAAAWMQELVDSAFSSAGWRSPHEVRHPTVLLTMLRRIQAAIIADKKPVALSESGRWRKRMDPDLLDLALELGIPLKAPSAQVQLSFRNDNDDDDNDQPKATAAKGAVEPRNRDPVHILKDPRFVQLLVRSFEGALDKEKFRDQVAASIEQPGWSSLARTFVEGAVAKANTGGVLLLRRVLHMLNKNSNPAILSVAKDAMASLGQLDLAALLARTFAAPLGAEWSWPAFEEAWRELDAMRKKKDDDISIAGAFPFAVVHDKRTAIVVGAAGRVLKHDLQVPKSCNLNGCAYIDGQLLVWWWGNSSYQGYWSAQPKDIKTLDHFNIWSDSTMFLPVAGGGVSHGGKRIKAGDGTLESRYGPVYGDGQRIWTAEYEAGSTSLKELNVETGKSGAASRPSFLLDPAGLPPRTVDLRASSLMPLPTGLGQSMLGSKEGLVGHRVLVPKAADKSSDDDDDDDDDDVRGAIKTFERIDGRSYTGSLAVTLLVDAPGGSEPVLVRRGENAAVGEDDDDDDDDIDEDDDRTSVVVYDPISSTSLSLWNSTKQSGPPPLRPFWHFMQARDPKASAAIRAIGTADLQALLAAAVQDLPATSTDKKIKLADGVAPPTRMPLTRAALAARVKLNNEVIVDAVIDQLEQTVKAMRARDALTTPGAVAKKRSKAIDDDELDDALGPLQGRGWGSGSVVQVLDDASGFLFGDAASVDLKHSHIGWLPLLGRLRSVCFLAASPMTSAEHRALLVALLRAFLATPFVQPQPNARVIEMEFHERKLTFLPGVSEIDDDEDDDGSEPSLHIPNTTWMRLVGNNRFVSVLSGSWKPYSVMALQVAPDGKFVMPQGAVLKSSRSIADHDDHRFVAAFLEGLDTHGPTPWVVDDLAALAEITSMSRSEAALLWTGLPVKPYQNDFLGKDKREQLGALKVAEAAAAKESLSSISTEQACAIYAGAFGADAASWWSTMTSAQRTAPLASSITRTLGTRVAIGDDIVLRLTKEVTPQMGSAAVLQLLANPAGAAVLKPTTAVFDEDGDMSGGIDSDLVVSTAATVAHLVMTLPAGHALLKRLPAGVAAVRQRLLAEHSLIQLGSSDYEDQKRNDAFYKTLVGKPLELPKRKSKDDDDDNVVAGIDLGSVVVTKSTYSLTFFVRPNQVRDWTDPTLKSFADIVSGQDVLGSMAFLLSADADAMMARIDKTVVADGAFEAVPSLSAPATIKQVMKKYPSWSADAATLYLQLLALPAPTDKNIEALNGWKKATRVAAQAELVAAGVVIEGVRERSGRSVFLPGAFLPMHAPTLPMETWKLPLFGIDPKKPLWPLAQVLPICALHTLFERAWARLEAGELPGYDDVSNVKLGQKKAAKKGE